ncbi:hypothetical protein HX049_17850 [Myroides odoratimimus]|uniref:hypothetical protein n=1 Tax=Myroides odoratimimus TaxID=76832 RepID=UPI00257637CC|nr:hypothetical protein [Myroides odoratimimus]MDM1399000.1 hypothetical protein [Myroides odoratimimus]
MYKYDTLICLVELIEKSKSKPTLLIDSLNNKIEVKFINKNFVYNFTHEDISKAVEELEPLL